MNSVIDNQRSILLSVHGTNIWSGQVPQKNNSQAITWGGLSKYLFAVGKRYQWVPWAYVFGLFVPIPFWLAHRFNPKIRTDYIYTPVIWYTLRVDHKKIFDVSDTATTWDGWPRELILNFYPASSSVWSRSGTCEHVILNGSASITTLWLQVGLLQIRFLVAAF